MIEAPIPVPNQPAPPADFSGFDFGDEPALAAPRRSAGRAWSIVLAVLAIAWVAGACWLARAELNGLGTVALVEFVAAVASIPVLLGVVGLILLRNSRAEARRFGATAQAMRSESARLEDSIRALTRTIEANQAQLGAQVASLVSTADGAGDRLASVGQALAGQVAQADEHARTLADAANRAETSLGVLLASLPRAQAQTVEVGKLLERTGLTASEHAAALDARLVALAERGREADTVAGGAAQRLAAHIMHMDATSETAGTRLEAVTGSMSQAIDALLDRTAQAMDEARKGIAAQGEAMVAMVGANQAALDDTARESVDSLAQRIAGIEDAIERIGARLDAQRAQGDIVVEQLTRGLSDVEGRIDSLHDRGVERATALGSTIDGLTASAEAMATTLKNGEAVANRGIGTTETLLIAIDAVAREIDETLPAALGRLDERVAASRQVLGETRPELNALVTAAEGTHDTVEAIAATIADQRHTLEQVSATLLEALSAGRTRTDELGTLVDETIGRANRFADEAAPRLVEALIRVRETASAAADKARETLAAVIPEAADALAGASAEAMRRATTETVSHQVNALAEAADAAAQAATRATETMMARLQALGEQTAAISSQVDDWRAERDQADQESLGRRAALLIDALHSASIDIAKPLAAEVPDTAWSAYLSGDRGSFTRRAVRIVEGQDVRAILSLYDADAGFREEVNRYVHDFEAMIRAVLTGRDGSPLAVTLLSSDFGKLYVVLAQAIERLR